MTNILREHGPSTARRCWTGRLDGQVVCWKTRFDHPRRSLARDVCHHRRSPIRHKFHINNTLVLRRHRREPIRQPARRVLRRLRRRRGVVGRHRRGHDGGLAPLLHRRAVRLRLAVPRARGRGAERLVADLAADLPLAATPSSSDSTTTSSSGSSAPLGPSFTSAARSLSHAARFFWKRRRASARRLPPRLPRFGLGDLAPFDDARVAPPQSPRASHLIFRCAAPPSDTRPAASRRVFFLSDQRPRRTPPLVNRARPP